MLGQETQEELGITLTKEEAGIDRTLEALYNSDRVLHMAHGRIVGEFDPRTTSVHAMEEAIYE